MRQLRGGASPARLGPPRRIFAGLIVVLLTVLSGTPLAQRLPHSGDCRADLDDNGRRVSLIFPTPLSSLRSHCATLLECEALTAQAEHRLPGDGAFRDWLRSTSEARRQRACDLREQCIENARALVQTWPRADSSTPHLYPLIHRSWRERAWAAELAEALDTGAAEAGQRGQARCPRIATRNHLRRPLYGRLEIAMELTRHLYGLQCDSISGCLRAGGGLDAWQQEQQWNRAREQDAREPLLAAAAGTLALEAQQVEQNKALREQAERLREHGERLSTSQEVSALTLAGALNEALQTQRPMSDIKSSQSWHASSPSKINLSVGSDNSANANTGALNVTEAMLLQARSTEQLAENTQAGLQQIADALLAAAGQRAADSGAVARQIDPEVDLERLYPDATRFGYALLLVPDPRIPRHRRGYDLLIATTNEGMLDAGYVLDRYAVPWQAYLDSVSSGAAPNGQAGLQGDDGQYGILVYRKDDYRSGQGTASSARHQLRVLYVVAESGTYGVQARAFARALQRVVSVLQPESGPRRMSCNGLEPRSACSRHLPLDYRGGHFAAQGGEPRWVDQPFANAESQVLVIGPAFSGSVTSIHSAFGLATDLLQQDRLFTRPQITQLNAKLIALARLESLLPAHRSDMARVRSSALAHFAHGARDGRITHAELTELRLVLEAHPCASRTLVGSSQNHCADLQTLKNELSHSPSNPAALAMPSLRLVSTSTTARSNYNIYSERFVHHSLAVPDSIKLAALHALYPRNCVGGDCMHRDVVIFSEASTFGAGLCPRGMDDERSDICGRAYEIRFPANIADIRARQQGESARTRRQAMDALGLASSTDFLDLAQGSENGSEYPDSQRSPLTSATSEIELERSLQQVRAINPRLVIIAATDVRDRLFLVNQLRRAAPRALLIDLEVDALMAHPRIIHASRGMLMLSSGHLETQETCCRKQSLLSQQFASDRQRAAHAIMRGLQVADSEWKPRPQPHMHLAAYVPTRTGLQLALSGMVASSNNSTSSGAARGSAVLMETYRFWPWETFGQTLIVLALIALLVTLARQISSRDRLIARIQDIRFARVSVASTSLAGFAGLLLYRQSLPPLQASTPYILAPSTGFAFAHALFAALIASAVLLYLHWLGGHYARLQNELAGPEHKGQPAADALARPLILSEGPRLRRYLPGADLVSWPLYLAAVTLGGVIIGSFGESFCPSCWPRESVLGAGWELLLMLIVVALSTWSVWSVMRAFALFRRVLGSAERTATLIRRGLGSDLTDWSELPPAHLRSVHTDSEVREVVLLQGSDADRQPATRPTWVHPNFAQTPLLARPSAFEWALVALRPGATKHADVRNILLRLNTGFVDGLELRLALALHFANLIAHMRVMLFSSLLSSLSVVLIGYLYPVTDRDLYLLFALLLMLLTSTLIIYAVIALERLPAVSRLLCNSPKGLELNWPVLASIGSPLLILLAVLLVMEVPGVLEWSGGLVALLFGWTG